MKIGNEYYNTQLNTLQKEAFKNSIPRTQLTLTYKTSVIKNCLKYEGTY
jgi:hypothetical protein